MDNLLSLIERANQLLETGQSINIRRSGHWKGEEWVPHRWEVFTTNRGKKWVPDEYGDTLEETLQKFIQEQEFYIKSNIVWQQARLDGVNVKVENLPKSKHNYLEEDSDIDYSE